jgi:diguanylate cyclase (GGDEF)-like protein
MKVLQQRVLLELVSASDEPVLVANVAKPDWPIAYSNPAFDTMSDLDGSSINGRPFADVVEELLSREAALDVSAAVRAGDAVSMHVELDKHAFELKLVPLHTSKAGPVQYYAAFWQSVDNRGAGASARKALTRAQARIRDLSREDPVTGLPNEKTFREVLAHDWAVAGREESRLGLISFTIDDFAAYESVFGKHAADSCMRKVAHSIRRFLLRASDVAAKINDDTIVVLSHSSPETGATQFAARITDAIRDLGIHHPRSSISKFVTVRYSVLVENVAKDSGSSDEFLGRLLGARGRTH